MGFMMPFMGGFQDIGAGMEMFKPLGDAAMSASNTMNEANSRAASIGAQGMLDQMDAHRLTLEGAALKKKQDVVARQKIGGEALRFLSSGVTLEGSPIADIAQTTEEEYLKGKELKYEKDVQANKAANASILAGWQADQALEAGSHAAMSTIARAGTSLLGGMF